MDEKILNKILIGVEKNADEQKRTADHLKDLNGQVGKHNEWINRYDIRVSEDIPDNTRKVAKINVKLAGVAATVSIVLTLVYFILRSI